MKQLVKKTAKPANGPKLITVLFIGTSFAAIIFYALYLHNNPHAGDSALIPLAYFLIEFGGSAYGYVSREKRSYFWKRFSVIAQCTATVFNLLIIMLLLLPHAMPPKVYSATLTQVPSEGTSVYKIEVETNLTTSSVVVYENDTAIKEISQYEVIKNRHQFSAEVEIEHFEPEEIVLGILRPSGEIIKSDVTPVVFSTMSVSVSYEFDPTSTTEIIVSAATSMKAAKVAIEYSSPSGSFGEDLMTSVDGKNWTFSIYGQAGTTYDVSVMAYADDGNVAEDRLTITCPDIEPSQGPVSSGSPDQDDVEPDSDPDFSPAPNPDPEPDPSSSPSPSPSPSPDPGLSLDPPDDPQLDKELTVIASCVPINGASDLLDFYGLSDLSELVGLIDLAVISDLNAIIVADTNFDATNVYLESSSETMSYGRSIMTSSDNRHWIFAANFFERSTFTIVVTAYAADGRTVTSTLTVTYPFH